LFHIIWLAGIDKSSSMCILQKMTHHQGFTMCSGLSSFSCFVLFGWQEWNQHACTSRGYILAKQQYQFSHSSNNVWLTGIESACNKSTLVQCSSCCVCCSNIVLFVGRRKRTHNMLHSNTVHFFAVVASWFLLQ
jgi:hypothetical protein